MYQVGLKPGDQLASALLQSVEIKGMQHHHQAQRFLKVKTVAISLVIFDKAELNHFLLQ